MIATNFRMLKRYIFLLSCVLVTALVLALAGCSSDKKNDPEPISDVQLAKLSKTWKLTEVTLDGVSKKSDYSSFQLSLNGAKGSTSFTYTATGRPLRSAWPAGGNFKFGSDVQSQLIRDPDQVMMTYVVGESSLQLNFNFSGDGYTARNAVVKGQWVFMFGL